ncbi:hypothetical protein [Natronorubrum texcoconense]|uniref:Uncharacterized protein n=1 Tax=Natronorubrum texcoconense TaxID=1095776 RepID=A0A1G9G013_9EURY|nr:hypothetical protein [Natronorubrum texcoconense]SDK93945.1 hypothetical protein SAMN04515672_4362 [Natronorubrum texcoconense]
MDSKRPDVRLDDNPDEAGRVTNSGGEANEGTSQSLLWRIRSSLRR